MRLGPPEPEPEPEPQARVCFVVAYEGSPFHGFAYQANLPTVAGALRTALAKPLGYEPAIACAGRTDAGVHAWGQVITFDVPQTFLEKYGDVQRLQRTVNGQVGPSIVVREAMLVDDSFHSRFSATARHYRYSILNAEVANPFLASTVWRVPTPLDVVAMNEAATLIVGEYDFSSFCRRPPGGGHLVRRVLTAQWLQLDGDLLRLDISAKAFCHQMVRSLVGTLVEVGLGRRVPGDMRSILEGRNRQLAARPAPPQGLCLWQVEF